MHKCIQTLWTDMWERICPPLNHPALPLYTLSYHLRLLQWPPLLCAVSLCCAEHYKIELLLCVKIKRGIMWKKLTCCLLGLLSFTSPLRASNWIKLKSFSCFTHPVFYFPSPPRTKNFLIINSSLYCHEWHG
jgi:hypothetical protein